MKTKAVTAQTLTADLKHKMNAYFRAANDLISGTNLCVRQQMRQDKLVEHKLFIDKNGEDLPEIRNWKWKN